MDISKLRQQELTCDHTRSENGAWLTIGMELGEAAYDIILGRGCLNRAGELLDLNRKVMIVTGELVPPAYAENIASRCAEPFIRTVPR